MEDNISLLAEATSPWYLAHRITGKSASAGRERQHKCSLHMCNHINSKLGRRHLIPNAQFT